MDVATRLAYLSGLLLLLMMTVRLVVFCVVYNICITASETTIYSGHGQDGKGSQDVSGEVNKRCPAALTTGAQERDEQT